MGDREVSGKEKRYSKEIMWGPSARTKRKGPWETDKVGRQASVNF